MEENREIDLLQLASAILKKWWVVVLSALLVGGCLFSYTYFCIEPTYSSNALFYVNNTGINLGSASISLSSADITASKSLVETYKVILSSRLCLEEVASEVKEISGIEYEYDDLNKMIVAEQVNSTEIFSVTVTTDDPAKSSMIANVIARVLPTKVQDIIDKTSVKVVDYAVVNPKRVGPNYKRNTVLGALVGALFAAAAIVIIEMLNDAVRSEDWLTETFGEEVPLLAVVPDASSRGSRHYGKYYGKYGRYDYSYYDTSNKQLTDKTNRGDHNG